MDSWLISATEDIRILACGKHSRRRLKRLILKERDSLCSIPDAFLALSVTSLPVLDPTDSQLPRTLQTCFQGPKAWQSGTEGLELG